MGAKWKHRLLAIDEATGTGECAACGQVRLSRKPSKGWRCAVAVREQRGTCPSSDMRRRAKHIDRLTEAQDGRCAICGEKARLVVDHAHDTGQVRAALCHPCNVTLGFMRESPALCRAAADYLEAWGR